MYEHHEILAWKTTAPRDTHSLVNHESEATYFDAAVFLSGFTQTETVSPLSCLKPTEVQELVDIVRDALQNPDKQPPPAALKTLVGLHERAVIEYFLFGWSSRCIEKYYSLSFSIRSESAFLNADFPPKFLNTRTAVPNRYGVGPLWDISDTWYDQMK